MSGGAAQGPRLLDLFRQTIRARHYSRRTEKAYAGWIKRYVLFHGRRHPRDLGVPEVTRFLSSLAVEGRVSASTQNQAFSALLFLYREVMGQPLPGLDEVVRAKRPTRLPLVLTRDEVQAVLKHLHGVPWLMASLMYGAGLRLLECARLRVKDVDFKRRDLTIRDGKGQKDRMTVLPDRLAPVLEAHLNRVEQQYLAVHSRDVVQ
jgi:integrase